MKDGDGIVPELPTENLTLCRSSAEEASWMLLAGACMASTQSAGPMHPWLMLYYIVTRLKHIVLRSVLLQGLRLEVGDASLRHRPWLKERGWQLVEYLCCGALRLLLLLGERPVRRVEILVFLRGMTTAWFSMVSLKGVCPWTQCAWSHCQNMYDW
jgi:hypothetical protein